MDEPDNELVNGSGLALLSWPGRRGVGGASCGQPRRCLGWAAQAVPGVGSPGGAWGRKPGPLQAISLP